MACAGKSLACLYCQQTFSTINGYAQHCKFHRNECNSSFPCPMNDCLSRFTTYSNFKSHLLREHGGKSNYGRKPTYHIETSLQCSISFCNQIVYTREALIKHLKEHLDAGTKIKCPISDCVRFFHSKTSFTSHLSKDHISRDREIISSEFVVEPTNLLGPTASNSLIDDGHTNDSFEFLPQSDIFDVDECIDDLEAVHETRDIEDLFVKNIMLFYLKLEAKHTIPATTVQDIVEQMQDIHSLGESVMCKNCCCSTGPLRSDHVRKATYKKMFQYVAPVPISLGRNNYGKERSFYYVPDAIFKQLITDLKDIECTGIDILNNGQNVKGTVCWYCLVTHGDFAENPNNSGELRTIENYKRALDQLQTARNPPNANHVQGIKFNSLFNEMDFFHVCPTGLPPCLGHDLFEGVVNYDVALFVQYYIKEKKWFTYSELNRRILHFKYLGSDKNNGLCEVNLNGEKLGGQAVQNWYFLRFLPLIIGYKISEPADPVWQMFLQLKYIVELVCAPKINEANIAYLAVLIDQYLEDRQTIFENHKLKPKHHYLRQWAIFLPLIIGYKISEPADPVWQMFLQLKYIVELVCAPKINEANIAYLAVLIDQYLEDRQTIFENHKLKPKHHYLRHYPYLILQFGPLIHVWTMRFESKHAYFKRCVRYLQNFKNLSKTLTERHQMLIAYRCAGSFFPDEIVMKDSIPLHLDTYSSTIQDTLGVFSFTSSDYITCELGYMGTTYKTGNFLITGKEDDMIVFGEILYIMKCKNQMEIYFLLRAHQSVYDDALHVYSVSCKNREAYICLKHEDLLDYYPLNAYGKKSNLLITLKHAV
ncbi:Zinc finger protein ZXDC [Nymphon striatum]|nr:Zinc finger protein ZXDC [Nymphon striatum]